MKIKITNHTNFAQITLIFLFFVAFFLRLYRLGSIPPHLTPDEASLGYNAYSILKTGKDEYGEILPMVFKSFGDHKPGLYIYLTVPFVAVFGLTEFAVRLPSALAGIAAVYLVYLIVQKILKQIKYDKNHDLALNVYQLLPLLCAFLLAINPWHIHFSRGAWEANMSLSFTLAGMYFFFASIANKKPNFLKGEQFVLSSIFFALTYITYQGAKLSSTLVILILGVLFFNEVKRLFTKQRRYFYSAIGVGLLICLPVISSFFTGKTGRLEVFSVFSYPRPVEYTQEFLDQGQEQIGDANYFLFHSEALNLTRGVLGRYFNHFSSGFLFFEGDWQNPRHSAPYHGMMLILDSVLIILGAIYLIKRSDKMSAFIFAWLLLAPLPAALSRDQVQAVRSLNMLIPLVLISSLGFYQVLMIGNKYKKTSIKISFFISFAILYLASFIYYLDSYFVHLPINDAEYWNYGYKQTVISVAENTESNDKIVFQQSFAQPYIYYLFFNSVEPSEYQRQARLTDSGIDVGLVPKVDNIEFIEYSWPPPSESGDFIIGDTVVVPEADPDGYQLIDEIRYPEGKPAFRIIRKE